MTPDWTKAPKSATHFNINNGCWYRRKFYEVQVWRDDAWKYTHTTPLILPHFIEKPDDAESSGCDK
jgi:hypothetical protein